MLSFISPDCWDRVVLEFDQVSPYVLTVIEWVNFLIAVGAYLLGSIPSGFLMARARGVDITKVGSGNIGATNAFRVLGKTAGTLVLLADALKGFLAVRVLPELFATAPLESQGMLAGLCVILGHNYTCWLKFKGGKGIATSAGVLLALTPLGLAWALGTWILVFLITRYVSVASLVAALILPFAVWFCGGTNGMIVLTSVFSALAIYKHQANIQRLLNGTESRFISKKKIPH